ncbi:MAG: FHA domain-containing protein [Pelosinus sp.]|nr:FHA domain-containing protein [Pelosinus sp.]
MPDKMLVLNIVGVILQYCFVALVYLFLLKIIRVIYKDLKLPEGKENSYSRKTHIAQLTLVDAGGVKFTEQEFSIAESLSIGRANTNDIAIDATFVSHEHVCITKNRGQYLITDLNSTNGTFLNGRRLLEEKVLTSGDLIKIGPAVFKFER